jgi:hypothetical protein
MMFSVDGTVAAILKKGFAICRHPGESETIVLTQIPGRKLSLKIGDFVHVLGGFSDKEPVFLSSCVSKRGKDRSMVDIRVNWGDPPDEDSVRAKKPWWRFW